MKRNQLWVNIYNKIVKMDKQIIQEVSRIHELMGVKKHVINEQNFPRLADDIIDIIKSISKVDDISDLSRAEQEFFSELDGLLRGRKDDEIIDFLKSFENNPSFSKYISEIETTLFNKINTDNPELQNLTDSLKSYKEDGSYSDEDILSIINDRMSEIGGSKEYKELYVKKLKKELGIDDSVRPTNRRPDEELLLPREEMTPQRVQQETAELEQDVNRLEDDALRLSGEELQNKMDGFIDEWSKKLREADLKLPPKRRFFKKNQDYIDFVDELKKGMKDAFKAYGESIDKIPQQWFEDFSQLPAEKQKQIFERAIQGATTWKPKTKAGKVWDKTVDAYDWATLKPILSKLPGGEASGMKGWLKRLGYRYLITAVGQMWFTFISGQYKKFTDEDLTNLSATNKISDWITGEAQSGSPRAVAGQMVSFLLSPLFTPWNLFAGGLSTIEYTRGTPEQVGEGKAASIIKDLEDQGLLSADVDSLQTILEYISSVVGENVEGSETYNPKLSKNIASWKANYAALQQLLSGGGDYKDILFGLPVSGGLNQLVVDKNKDLHYIGNNGAFKIKGEGVNSYIDAVDSEGNQVQIKVKDIFEDKYNRFLSDYRPLDEQPKSENYVQFWPKTIKWDQRGGNLNDKFTNTIGVWNPNLVSILTPITNYLRNSGVSLPSKYIQSYGFYKTDELERDVDGNYELDNIKEVDSFPYLVEDGKAYRIYKADENYNLKDSEGNDIEKDVYYVTDGTKWYPLLSKAKEILGQSNNTPTSIGQEKKWGSIKPVGNQSIYYTGPNYTGDRYKMENGEFVKF